MRWIRVSFILILFLALLPTNFIAAQALSGEIVFVSDRDGGFVSGNNLENKGDIYVMNADGSNLRKLTDTANDPSPDNEDWNDDTHPRWSPDGSRIAFGRGNDLNLFGALYVMYANGSGLTDITPSLTDEFYYTEPAWSPDGHQLLFGNDGVIELIGTSHWTGIGNGFHPDWSPDGLQIVYVSDTYPTPAQDIMLLTLDDSDPINLTNDVGDNQDPDWSPDGTKIAFASDRGGNYDIYVMNADGSGLVRLMNNQLSDREPAWSPDGTQIAFTRVRHNGNAEIFVMNANGGNQTNITNSPGNDRQPDWKAADQVGQRTLLVSSNTDGQVGGVRFKDEDILAYNLDTHHWQMYFDGSDVGIYKDVNALAVQWDGSLLLSFNATHQIDGVGKVADTDIVRFTPTSLGTKTAGSFALDLVGADYGLTTDDEDIDAIGINGYGNALGISTVGNFKIPYTHSTGKDEDLLGIVRWRNDYWTYLYLDGSTVGLTRGKEDIGGVWFNGLETYLSVLGPFAVPGVTGDGADIFVQICNDSGCVFQPYWDGSSAGFGKEVIDAFEFVYMAAPTINAATVDDDDPYAALDDEFADDDWGDDWEAPEGSPEQTEIFIPLVQR